jgi:predicted DNA repair protein MutK
MSAGLLALLDDVAGIAKVAAASIDDVAAQAVKAGSKAAGAVIDDAAVTPKYVHGFDASRELPMIWRIAKGSLFNKIVILLPIALLLSAFAPWLIPLLLMLGGGYLCFEGAEKILHALHPHQAHDAGKAPKVLDPAALEDQQTTGAIRTDFILSAEIMTIALAAIPLGASIWMQAGTLFLVGVGITAVVYGAVALIVKADDAGLHMARHGRLAVTRGAGRGLVKAMPGVMKTLTVVGTAAMLWVGGAIIIHALQQIGWGGPEHLVHGLAHGVGHLFGEGVAPAMTWGVGALLSGLIGLGLGWLIVQGVERVVMPLRRAVGGRG